MNQMMKMDQAANPTVPTMTASRTFQRLGLATKLIAAIQQMTALIHPCVQGWTNLHSTSGDCTSDQTSPWKIPSLSMKITHPTRRMMAQRKLLIKFLEQGVSEARHFSYKAVGTHDIVKKANKASTMWRCSVRNKNMQRGATVWHKKCCMFTLGAVSHNHEFLPNLVTASIVETQVIQKA